MAQTELSVLPELIDVHPHIISTDTTRYPIAPLHGIRSGWSENRPKTFEQLVAEMDAAGVDKACIVHSSTTYGFDPSYLADIIDANPDRFAGVFSMDVMAPDSAKVFRKWVGRGLSGIRLFTAGSTTGVQSDALADPRSFAVWEAAGELEIPVTVQMRPQGLHQLLSMVKRFPEVTVLVDNTMRPIYAEGPPYYGSEHVFVMAQYENVHLKIITNGILAVNDGRGSAETFYPRLVAEFGANRLTWGSNFPASEGSLAELVAKARTTLGCLSSEDQSWIFARTARRLFPKLAGAKAPAHAD